MRPVKELADVAAKLEVLEDTVQQLQDIIEDIRNVITKCTSWIYETETTTYQDIKQMLVSKTRDYVQQFFLMAYDRNGKLSEPVITGEQMENISETQKMEASGLDMKETFGYKKLAEKLKAMSTSVESNKDMIEILQGKNKVLEKKVKRISEQNQANGNISAEHYKEIMEELSVASSFMSNLKDENIKLRTELSEHNKKMENVSQKVNKSTEIASEFDELKKQNHKLTGDCAKLQVTLEIKEAENRKLMDDIAMDQHLLEELKKQNQKLTDDCAELQVTLEMKEAENRKLMDDIGLIPKSFLEKVKRSLKDAYATGVDLFLVGPTGHGKSAVGNSILQKKCFKSTLKIIRVVQCMQHHVGKYRDLCLSVYDFPVFCFRKNQHTNSIYLECDDLRRLVKRSKYVCVILVLKFGHDLTQEDINYINGIKSNIDQNILKDYGILIMTRGDLFKQNTEEAISFQDWLQRQDGYLKEILTEFNGRALLFDNMTEDEDVQKKQLHDFLCVIHEMILNKISMTIA